MPVHFRPARDVHDRALAILEAECRRLLPLLPWGELSLTGGSSIPDALTRGDVDLLLSVPPDRFRVTLEALLPVHRAVHRELWTDEFATFEVDDEPLPTGIAVIVAGTEHDRYFREAWRLLGSDPERLAAYNDLKREHAAATRAPTGEPRLTSSPRS